MREGEGRGRGGEGGEGERCEEGDDEGEDRGFITKHPETHRYACHVFHSEVSTRPVAEAFG